MAGNPTPAVPPLVMASQVAESAQVVANIFTRKILNNLSFSSGKVWVLADGGYNSIDTVLCWKLNEIREW